MSNSEIPKTFMGGGAAQPPKSELSSQQRLDSLLLQDISVQPAEAKDKATAFIETQIEPGDIESFLADNTSLFLMCESSWHDVQDKIAALDAVNAGGIHLFQRPDGKAIVKRADDGTGRLKRNGEAVASAYTSSCIRTVRERIGTSELEKMATHIAKGFAEEETLTLEALSDRAIENTNRKKALKRDRLVIHEDEEHGDQLVKAVGDLQASYLVAFAFQHLAIRRITDLLQADANVEPFVDRLKTVLKLRSHGMDEFPGMLEVINVMIQQQQVAEGASSLEKAIQRVAPQTHSLVSFTERMLTQDKPEIEGQSPPGFRNVVIGAKLVAQAIELDDSLDASTGDISKIIARHMPALITSAVWADAHEADAASRARAEWRRLLRDIQRYECRGRVPDIAVERSSSTQARGVKSRATSKVVKPRNTDELQHLIAEDEARLPVLGIMKQFGTTRVHTPRAFDEVEEFFEHNMVTKFLAEHPEAPDLGTAIQRFTRCILQMPTFPPISEALRAKRFSIDADGFPRQSFPLRRFKPNATALKGLPQHALHERVRIIFGLVPGRESSFLLVKSVTLRERDTYHKL